MDFKKGYKRKYFLWIASEKDITTSWRIENFRYIIAQVFPDEQANFSHPAYFGSPDLL
jgi:hypothetical protein